jgi:hypothetical protein
MVATSEDEIKAQWRSGLRLLQDAVAKSSPAEVVAQLAPHEFNPTNELQGFFHFFKSMTVNGYYTSKIGIEQELEYVGNTYVADFPGFPPLV